MQDGVNGVHISTSPDGTSTLTIDSPTSDQTGQLGATAKNETGSDTTNSNLKVEPSKTAPVFSSKLQDKSVDEGQPIRFDVSVENQTPDTKVSWYMNEKELQPGVNGVQIGDNGDGNYTLSISSAALDMSGQLKAVAKNSAGSNSSEAQVCVFGLRVIQFPSYSIFSFKLNVRPSPKKPEFTKVPQDHQLEEDSSPRGVKFSAIVAPSVPLKVTWFLKGQPIISGDDIRVKYDEQTGKTSIRIFKPVVSQVSSSFFPYTSYSNFLTLRYSIFSERHR